LEIGAAPARQDVVIVIRIKLDRQPDLFQIIDALGLPCLGLGFGKRGEEQRGENGDDGNHHKKLNQRERRSFDFTVLMTSQ